MIYYKVGGKKFANPYAAFMYGAHNDSHTFPQFNCFEQEFDLINWELEPLETFESLCNRRAHQLRARYEWLILSFSGGTDSTTIYNTFIRNKIHIDEIYVCVDQPRTGPANSWQDQRILEWLYKNHKDTTTKITTQQFQAAELTDRTSSRFQSQYYIVSPDLNSHFKFHPALFDSTHRINFSNRAERYCIVTGFEKPRIIYEDGRYYSSFVDGTFITVMMRPDIEFFYVTPDLPELHCKQCHMLLNTCNNLGITLEEINQPKNYYIKAAACGRDSEVFAGNSQQEKIIAQDYSSKIKSINFDSEMPLWFYQWASINPSARSLNQNLQTNSDSWKNYKRSWAGLQTDQTLINYLQKHKLLDHSSKLVHGYHNINSKQLLIK